MGCSCRAGRDFDGSEFGPCEHCERTRDEDAARIALIKDAARWRMSRFRCAAAGYMVGSGGYFHILGDDFTYAGIQPHPVTKATGVNHCIMGRGKSVVEAMDGLFASLSAYAREGATLPADLEAIRVLFDDADQEQAAEASVAPGPEGDGTPTPDSRQDKRADDEHVRHFVRPSL